MSVKSNLFFPSASKASAFLLRQYCCMLFCSDHCWYSSGVISTGAFRKPVAVPSVKPDLPGRVLPEVAPAAPVCVPLLCVLCCGRFDEPRLLVPSSSVKDVPME